MTLLNQHHSGLVITLTQNAVKGAWKGLRRCYIKKTSLNHPKLYSMFAILQCHALKVLWWSQSLKIFMRLSSSRDGFKLRRAAAFAVVFCASLPSSNIRAGLKLPPKINSSFWTRVTHWVGMWQVRQRLKMARFNLVSFSPSTRGLRPRLRPCLHRSSRKSEWNWSWRGSNIWS